MKKPGTLTALLLGWGVLVAYGAHGSKTATAAQKDAALAGAVIASLLIGFVGEFAPDIATAFAGMLLVGTVLAGPANGFDLLTKIPLNLAKGSTATQATPLPNTLVTGGKI